MNDSWLAFYSSLDPTELWDYMRDIIEKHLNIMCPIKFIRVRLDSPPWITQEIVEAINDRNRLFKLARTDNSNEKITNARMQRNRVNILINNSKSAYIKETLDNNKDNPKRFWRILNDSLLKGNNKPTHVVFNKDNEDFTNTEESCDYMNCYLTDIGRKLYTQFQNAPNDHVYENIYNYDSSDTQIVFTCDDIVCIVNNIDVHKGSGLDFLPSFVLKDCFKVLTKQLTYLFNQSIALGTFPDSWKSATVTPIPKAGELSQVTNWRPISILPLIGKMMEKLCNKILVDYVESQGILCDEQFGFRKKRSTSLAIFNYVKYLTDNINKRKLIGSMYIDFARAFDSINHCRLIEKLFDMGVPGQLVVWIEDYLNNRVIRTKLNNNISNAGDLLCGVPQGSILGPTLFLCYINDLAMYMHEIDVGIFLYADDAVIYHSGDSEEQMKSVLEHSFQCINTWCSKNYININVDKTKFCIYGTRSNIKKFECSQITQNNQTITRCYQYNYLGVLLDDCLNLKANFNKVFKKYSYKIYQFGKIKKYITTDTRILVYKQTILPLVEYVSFMLCLNSAHEVDKLQKLQNRCLRMCLNINNPRDMSVAMLHTTARVDELNVRREIHLSNLMYDLKSNGHFKKKGYRDTRSTEKYVFETEIVHSSIYSRSPYYRGAAIWNLLPEHIQKLPDKCKFKSGIKIHLGAN